MNWIDVTVQVRDGMVTWEGDPPVRLTRVAAMTDGALCNVSRLDFGVHTGTHIDAPAHFIDGGPGAESLDLDGLIGPALVVDATHILHHIDAPALDALCIPPQADRLLFKTTNSELWARGTFSKRFLGITGDGARWLAERGTRLVGIDYLSVAPFDDPVPTHVALLAAGTIVLEGLDLRGVEAGAYELVCLPLLIPGADGAPARVLLRPI